MCLEWLRDHNPRWDSVRNRLVLDYNGLTLGRDIYGLSKCKWYRYDSRYTNDNMRNSICNILSNTVHPKIALTEDIFSAIKGEVLNKEIIFIALLGTTLPKDIELAILHSQPKMVYLILDGDEAGQNASKRILKRLNLLGIKCINKSPKKGDPKDQSREWYNERFDNLEST